MVVFLRYKSSFSSIGFRVNSWLGLVDLGYLGCKDGAVFSVPSLFLYGFMPPGTKLIPKIS